VHKRVRERVHTHARTQDKQRLEGMEGMEEKEAAAALNKLIRAAMPKVVGLVADKRKVWGDAHVNECQRRGMRGEAGWFFAREGPVSIGVPINGWSDVMAWQLTPGQAMLFMREPTQQVHDGQA